MNCHLGSIVNTLLQGNVLPNWSPPYRGCSHHEQGDGQVTVEGRREEGGACLPPPLPQRFRPRCQTPEITRIGPTHHCVEYSCKKLPVHPGCVFTRTYMSVCLSTVLHASPKRTCLLVCSWHNPRQRWLSWWLISGSLSSNSQPVAFRQLTRRKMILRPVVI